ncbi:hypothetical protein LguiA_002028 [Lonicera macranthoides]
MLTEHCKMTWTRPESNKGKFYSKLVMRPLTQGTETNLGELNIRVDGDEDIHEKDAICKLCRLSFIVVKNVIKIECGCKRTFVAHEACASNMSVNNCNKCGRRYNHAPVKLVRVAVRAKVWSREGGLVDDVSSETENGTSVKEDKRGQRRGRWKMVCW